MNFQPNSFENDSVKRELGRNVINIVKFHMSQVYMGCTTSKLKKKAIQHSLVVLYSARYLTTGFSIWNIE